MIKDRVYDYYMQQDFNCAEAILHAANDEYALGIPEESFKLVGGFGGGMGCGKSCGALCGGISAIGYAMITDKAHATDHLRDYCTQYATVFTEKLGSDQCEVLVKTFKREDTRCLNAVLAAAELLDDVMSNISR